MATVYLVRHGITHANRTNRFAGRTGEKLLTEGVVQIRKVGERLHDKKIQVICCGPAKRTEESAAILGSLLGVPFSSRPEFHEIEIPHWDGLTKDEIRQQYGAQYPTWLSAPQTFHVNGCETLQQVQSRAVEGVSRILSEGHGQNLLLVSHLIVLRCLVLYYLGLGIKDFRSIKIDNGSILKVSENEKGGKSVEYI